MENEKMKILQMLQEGKITADEASKLLDSMSGKTFSGNGFSNNTNNNFSKDSYDNKNNYYSSSQQNNTDGRRQGIGLDDFTADLSKKFDALAKDWEPKLQKFTEIIVEKTTDIAEKISKSVEYSPKATTPPTSTGSTPYNERNFEIKVTAGYNELNFQALNGDINIKGYNGDKITAKVFCKPKKLNPPLELMKFGNKYTLNYDEADFDKVSIEAYVPEGLFNIISFQTINGRVDCSSLRTEYFKTDTTNSEVIIKDIYSDNIKIENGGGKLTISNVKAKNGQIENFNSDIISTNSDIENMKLFTSNGNILLNLSDFEQYLNYIWIVETNNGKLTLNMPSSPEIGYHVKAHTSLGSIKIGLVGLNYINSDLSNMEAKSINYETTRKKIKLSLETSNAPIVVN